ncbi:tRNA (N(6)-L-threonylcarbamoyladenosine(37)-C(2))-methylthiotransferase [Candidatus Woesearchaeota archaeon]|nr:tRNA (N(6)-L-threonylcarbamoyladenosine(37)-C(2))-methylthiotransferase [Candidatus Woesearchaeota archaeon]
MLIYIRTFGCAHNQADSEMMAGLLEEAGHELVASQKDAELIIFNSCTVKDSSQKRFIDEVKKAATEKLVVIAGCVPQADPNNDELKPFSVVGVKQLHKVVDVVEKTAQGKLVKENARTPKNPPLVTPIRRRNPFIEIIPVNSGCLGKCTFCKTKHARGRLSSYHHEEILEKARLAIAAGAKELWLTSEDLGAYGRDINTNIVEIGKKVLDLEGEFRVRLGMANPPLILDIVDGIIELLQHTKCYKFLHIPVQSGSNKVLENMRREYLVEEFEELVNKIKKEIPDITIATDIIVGFPGETEEDHKATMKLLKKYEFPVVNISKFYARPDTPAAKMKPVQTKLAKERSKEIHEWFESLNPHEYLVGQTVRVLFTERNEKYPDQIIGHTPNYREVVLKKGIVALGEFAEVKIESTERFFLRGLVEK